MELLEASRCVLSGCFAPPPSDSGKTIGVLSCAAVLGGAKEGVVAAHPHSRTAPTPTQRRAGLCRRELKAVKADQSGGVVY